MKRCLKHLKPNTKYYEPLMDLLLKAKSLGAPTEHVYACVLGVLAEDTGGLCKYARAQSILN